MDTNYGQTWADAFGLWHAVVPDSGNEKANRRLARALILWELQVDAPYQIRARAVPVVLVGGNTGRMTVEYREVDK